MPDPLETNKLIWQTVKQIPRGRVATYGQIADLAGLGRAARRVGRALRELPGNSDVPWFRVLRAGGRFAFPPGTTLFDRQRRRLEREGVSLLKGKVDLDIYGWQRSLDEILWKPDNQDETS